MRSALIVAHTGRKRIIEQTRAAGLQLLAAGFEVRMEKQEARDAGLSDQVRIVDGPDCAAGAEIALVLGGDGTFLRAAELARPAQVPLLGVNLGHVGFLAEAEPEDMATTIESLIECSYDVEERPDPRHRCHRSRRDRRPSMGPERGVGREELTGADARAGGIGRQRPVAAIRLRRGHLRHSDRQHRLRVLRRRADRLA